MLNTAGISKAAVASVKKTRFSSVTDSIDLLHSYYSVIILSTFSVLVGSGQLFGKPLQCIIAAHIDRVRGWSSYILGYCYVVGTTRNMTLTSEPTREDRVDYYQWLPLFFCFQIFCFRFLHLFWLWLQSLLYIDVKTILKESNSLSKTFDPNIRKQKAQLIAEYIWNYFYFRTLESRGWQKTLIHPSVFAWFYFTIKMCNLLHVLVQLTLVTKFLGFQGGWVVDLIVSFFTNDPPNYVYFPHEVYCTYQMASHSDIDGGDIHTSQCFLTINEYNEKILTILWVWFVIVSCCTLLNILYFLRFFTEHISITYLEDLKGDQSELYKTSREFFCSVMGTDGLLILNLITTQSGSMTSSLILKEIWNKYESSTVDRIAEYPTLI